MLNCPRRSLWRYLLVSSALAWSLGTPILDHSLTLPTAIPHHGGGGAGGGGGGKGNGTIPKAMEDGRGYGKGGRGFQGMKS